MADTDTKAWIPTKEGEQISGKVVEVVRAWSDARTNGGRDMDRGWYPLLHLEMPDGRERDWHAFGVVAENRVLEKQPMPGEHITVTYLGVSDKEPPKGQNAPKLFKLVIDGRDPATEARNIYAQLGAKPNAYISPPEAAEPLELT